MDKDAYVNEIKKGLQDLPDSDEWMEELESHISQAFAHYLNEGKTEKEAMMRIWHEVGSPADIIHSFKKETSVSPRGFLLFHFFCNLSLFAAGAALTMIHVWSVHPLVKAVWSGLSVSVWLILGGYLLYWMFIGYQAGREFGFSGKRLVHHTVSVSMAPNVCFMLVFLFGLVPADLFQAMLTPGFVLACAVATMLFPACSRLGCYVGRRRLA